VKSIYASWVGGPSAGQLPLICTDHDGRIQAAMRWMLEVFGARGKTAGPVLDALMLAVLDEAARSTTQSDNLQAKVTRYVRGHMDEPISLGDLAKDAAMSRWHFCRSYREEAKCTPMDTVRQVRIDAARHLLATTTLTVDAVAMKVGFGDRFHFSRVFKKMTGQTPASIRQ
jgi:transcriptional regulator GlxA family with amidase domain